MIGCQMRQHNWKQRPQKTVEDEMARLEAMQRSSTSVEARLACYCALYALQWATQSNWRRPSDELDRRAVG